MTKIERVSLVGAGAIGAAYGKKLHEAIGSSFTVIADKNRADRYSKQGIYVDGKLVRFHCVPPEEKTEPADLLLFAVKNAELHRALEDAKHHIGENTIILSLLNGISSEEEIFGYTGSNHILYGMCVGIDAVRENDHIHYSSLGKICFGEKNQELSTDVQAVKELFDRAGIAYEVPENIWKTIWAKFMFNVGINQISAVLKAPYQSFQEISDLHEWMEEAMYEVVAVSEKAGVHLTAADVESYRPILMKLSPAGKTSMLQDIEAGRRTEVDYFAGKVCELGREYGVPTPINEQLLKMISILEQLATIR